jgi:uncharacterized protein YybS (DUF2232 family)
MLEKSLDNGMLQGWLILTLTFLFAALAPFIGPLVIVLTPLPVLYHVSLLKRSRGFSILTASFVTACGVLALLKQQINLPMLFMIAFLGITLSEIIKRDISFDKMVLASALLLFLCGMGFIIYKSCRANITPWELIENSVAEVVKENIALYKKLDVPQEQIQMITEKTPQITRFFAGIFPALGISGSVVTVWANLLAGQMFFRLKGIPFPSFGDLTTWKVPEKLVWVLIAAGGMLFVPIEGIVIVGMNLLIITGLIYMFGGLAITAFFFRKKQISRMFRFFFYGLIMVQQYMLIFVIAVGLFDLWVDFRKRIKDIKNVDG